ncbi:MAG: ABC transporter ATP-binding protein [Gammaproteobacteria bacterium]|nr:ABC transporter ATP-binding protein [Gammaproteobacteria bacterium]
MPARLSLNAISKHYGPESQQVTALNEVSLSLEEGEFLAIQGPSGSGKSTLLNICGLIDHPSSGDYHLNGIAVAQLNEQQRCTHRRQMIGFIFQRHQLIPAMTVYENIAYPLLLNNISAKNTRYEVEQILTTLDLMQRRKHLPRQLSGGERQRVGIARALIKRPQLVIADEPSASLDHQHTHTGLQLMRELNQAFGASFLIASHDPFVIDHCDRRISLLDGRMDDRA